MIWPYGLGEIWTQMNLIPWIKCTAQRGKWGLERQHPSLHLAMCLNEIVNMGGT